MHQLAVPPYTFTCHQCGKTWDPLPAKNGTMSPGRLDRLAADHFKQCRPPVVDMERPPPDQEQGPQGSD